MDKNMRREFNNLLASLEYIDSLLDESEQYNTVDTWRIKQDIIFLIVNIEKIDYEGIEYQTSPDLLRYKKRLGLAKKGEWYC